MLRLNRLMLSCLMTSFYLTQFASAAFTSVSLTGSLAGATLEHQINLNDSNANGQDTITIRYTVPQTGWLAVGVNPTGSGMINGEVIIGKPTDDTVKKYKISNKSARAIAEQPNQTLINTSLQQTGGNTVMTFTKLLVEADEFTITAGASTTFIAAFGGNNNFGFHLGYGVQQVTLETGNVISLTDPPSTTAPGVPTNPPTTAAPGAPTNPPTTASPVIAPTSPPGAQVLNLSGDLAGSTFSYQFITTNGKDSISVTYTAPVTAWVGVGVSQAGLMVGSEAVIGIPSTGQVKKYTLSEKSMAGVMVMPEEKQTLVNTAITQANGMTTLTYTKFLVEDGELPIVRDGDNIFIAAQGASSVLGFHERKGSFTLNGQEIVGREKTLWIVHGCLAYLAWGIMCPMAILVSLIRMYIPGQRMWYETHRALQSLAIIFTVAAVAVAIAALNKETPDNSSASHFSADFADGHRVIGLLVLIFALLQAAGGIMRPHLPESNNTASDNDDEEKASSSSGSKKSSVRRRVWEVAHRLMGASLLGLTWYQIDLGIYWYHQIFDNGNVEPTASVWYTVIFLFAFLLLMGIAVKIMMGGKG